MNALKIIDGELSCRIADAIFFEDDSFSPIQGNSENGYKIQERISIDRLDSSGWAELYPLIKDKNDHFIVLAGETSWGGTGFITLKDQKEDSIKWVIHLSTMNNPKRIKIENELVRVTTDLNNPDGVDFIVPMTDPMNFKIEKLVANKAQKSI